jgi:hypothetical protein
MPVPTGRRLWAGRSPAKRRKITWCRRPQDNPIREQECAAHGSAGSVWIDPSLKFVIKWEDTDVGAELHNIKEGPQSADLFAVRAGYDVLKPQKKGHWKTQRR